VAGHFSHLLHGWHPLSAPDLPGAAPGEPLLRRRPPAWVYAPRHRWDLLTPLPADEVRARLEASPRFRGQIDERGRIGLVHGGRFLAVGPELRGDVSARTGGAVVTLDARLAGPVAIATTVWVALLVAAAIALTGLIAFGAIMLLAAGILGALCIGLAFQLAARSCLRELLRLLEADLVQHRPGPRV
jgi:hypothetical protein